MRNVDATVCIYHQASNDDVERKKEKKERERKRNELEIKQNIPLYINVACQTNSDDVMLLIRRIRGQ